MPDLSRCTDEKYISSLFKNIARQKEIPISIHYKKQQLFTRMLFNYSQGDTPQVEMESEYTSFLPKQKVEVTFFFKEVLYVFETKITSITGKLAQISNPKEIFTSFKRLLTRYQFSGDEKAFIYFNGQEQGLKVIDISTGGLSFETSGRIPMADSVVRNIRLEITMLGDLHVDAEVKHFREAGKDRFIYGLAFIGMEWSVCRALFNYIFSKSYLNLTPFCEISTEEIILLYNNSKILSLKQENDSEQAFLNAVQNLGKLGDKPEISSNLIYNKNEKLLALGSTLRIYNRTFLGQELLMSPTAKMNPKAKTDIYIGLAEFMLNHPYCDNYLFYIKADLQWHQEILTNMERIINDNSKLMYESLNCFECIVEGIGVGEEDAYYRVSVLDSLDSFTRDYVGLKIGSLEGKCYHYNPETFALNEIKEAFESLNFSIVRELWCIYKNDEPVAYAVAESYSEGVSINNAADTCRMYFNEETGDINSLMKVLIPAVGLFYGKNGKKSFTLCFKWDKNLEGIHSIKGIIASSVMGRVMMSREGLSEYKKLLMANFEYYTKYYPLTYPQKSIWYTEKVFPGTSIGNIAGTLKLQGEIDYLLLEKAINIFIEKNDAMRLRILEEHGEPRQYISDYKYNKFSFYDFSQKEIAELYQWDEQQTQIPFNLIDSDLFFYALVKMNETEGGFYVKVHHTLSDAWTMGLMGSQIVEYYSNLKKRIRISQVKKPSYIDYILSEEEYKYSDKHEKDKKFWKEEFHNSPEFTNLKLKNINNFNTSAGRKSFIISKKLTTKIHAYCKETKTSAFMLFLSMLAIYLGRVTGKEEVVIGTPVLNRSNAKEKDMVGMFISTIPVRLMVNGDCDFNTFVQRSTKEWMVLLKHQKYPYEMILEEYREKYKTSDNLYDVTLSFQNAKMLKDDGGEDYSVRWHPYGYQPESLNIHINDREDEGHYIINFDYLKEFFTVVEVERMYGQMINLLMDVLKNPVKNLSKMEMLSEAEKHKMLFGFNPTKVDYPKNKTIHQLFEEQVDKTPENIAVVFGEETLTYRELDERSNALANFLYNRKHAQPDRLIGIFMSNSILQVVAILGCLKAGGAYVPIDPELPAERVKSIVDDAEIKIMLSGKRHIKELNRLQWECKTFSAYVCLDSEDIYSENEFEKSKLMETELWEFVGDNATDEIAGGGWNNSYTGEPFTRDEMDEYCQNVLLKLKPYLKNSTNVLEIGCASGISMFKIAPLVKAYSGTDISKAILEKNRKRIKAEGIKNIKLEVLAAHDIDKICGNKFDIIIINSVIQCFHGHHYLRKVIKKAIDLIGEQGIVFIGDIMDQDLKNALIESTTEFKINHAHDGFRTKTDWSEELFVSKAFFKDLAVELKKIKNVQFTKKIHTIENELTKFRYDAVLEVDKTQINISKPRTKIKQQHGNNELQESGTKRITSKCTSNNLAYSIFTSGTTGKPKGVLIEHKSLVNLAFWHINHYAITADDIATRYAAPGFDASVWELFPYLITGASVHIIKDDIRLDVYKINEYFKENEITISFLPTQLCEKFMELENTTLKKLLTGGDKLRSFIKKDYALYNNYGPTEYSVVTSSFLVEGNTANIPIGKPVANTEVYIVDRYNNLQTIGAPGELCVSGDGLARGYLKRPELNEEKFVPNPFVLGTKMYRTGDLARVLEDGNIEFLGRRDNQVKIRGFRIELEEIEVQMLKHGFVKEAIVLDDEDKNGSRHLSAYFVAVRTLGISELREYLAKSLPEYMVPAYFIQVEQMPLTANGKIDRKALLNIAVEIDTGVEFSAPENKIEDKLLSAWQKLLGLSKIGTNEDFFELGGDSLSAFNLMCNIELEFNIDISLREIFEYKTIKEIAKHIMKAEEQSAVKIELVSEKEYYAVSSAQKRLFILNQFEGIGVGYNMPGVFMVEGNLDMVRLEEAFEQLIKRHDALRTCFKLIDGKPMQKISKDVKFEIEYAKSEEGKIHEMIYRFIKPFDLSMGPLFRIGLVTLNSSSYILLFDMHHIISDGISVGILIKELSSLYSGKELAEQELQYKDFAVWQNNFFMTDTIKVQKEYWLKVFKDEIPVLSLPTDYPRPVIQSFAGNHIRFKADKDLTGGLNKVAAETGATVYMVLLAAYTVLLSKYTSQEDIVVASPVAGRHHADLENVVGMFVNTLPMRNFPIGEKTFSDFLKEVKDNALEAFGNQDYPFDELIEHLKIQRDPTRNPLCDTMFALQNMDLPKIEMENLKFTSCEFENKISKFDLTLQAKELQDEIEFEFEYCTKLFTKETIQRMAEHLINMMQQVVVHPTIKLSEIEILAEEEKKQILFDFNHTKADYPKDKTIQQLFEEQVESKPDHVAVVFEDKSLTYRQLNEKANRLAGVLRTKGVKPDTIVGIMVERSLEMMIGILGILKAGGAYLPIDPNYPEQRIRYMLEDSKALLILTKNYRIEQWELTIEVLQMNENLAAIGSSANMKDMNKSSHLAYVIYTSGSTGRPKGVMIEHRSVINLVYGLSKEIYASYASNLHVALIAPFVFDASVQQIFASLLLGHKLFIVPEQVRRDGSKLLKYYDENSIDISDGTPTHISILSNSPLLIDGKIKVKHFIIGGEALIQQSVKDFLEHFKGNKPLISNVYGPTECCVDSTHFMVQAESLEELSSIPIGGPLPNIKTYILDRKLYPVCKNVTGELYISGAGVGRGYINNTELTKERFIQNPFISGEMMYKTGDLARWTVDGNIEFLGRMDRQVKIKGFRIELGEIESKLLKYSPIKEAVVLDRDDLKASKYLCAYYVSDEILTVTEIKNFLAQELPNYMIPTYFVPVQKIDMTINGKINYKALPNPITDLKIESIYEIPTNGVERKLVAIWQEILEVDRVGISDNFFELGGDSLKATILTYKIFKEFNVNISLNELFRCPYIKEIALVIKNVEKDIENRIDANLVLLKRASNKKNNLFFIHAGNGGIESYIRLCENIKADYNCWGIKADAYEDFIEIRVEDISRKYLEKIKKIQPEGPYFIVGWCIGGTIAFEMVKQLEIQKESIGMMVIISSLAPQKNVCSVEDEFCSNLIKGWAPEFVNDVTLDKDKEILVYTKDVWLSTINKLKSGILDGDKIRKAIPSTLAGAIPNFDKLNLEELMKYFNVIKVFSDARNRYLPVKKINTTLHYIKAIKTPEVDEKMWNKYCRNGMVFHHINGDHNSVFQDPYVKKLANIIDQHIL